MLIQTQLSWEKVCISFPQLLSVKFFAAISTVLTAMNLDDLFFQSMDAIIALTAPIILIENINGIYFKPFCEKSMMWACKVDYVFVRNQIYQPEDINFCWFSISFPLTSIVWVGSDRLWVLRYSTWCSCCLTIEVRLSTSLSFASRTNGRRNVVASSIGTTYSKGCGGCSCCSRRPYEIIQNREANGLD